MADNESHIESPRIESPHIEAPRIDSPRIETPERVRRRRSEDPAADYDGKPGSHENSKSYDRIYNPEGENEQTNLLENANEIELRHLIDERKARQARHYAATLAAQSQVQFWHGVGKFVLPQGNTWMAHFDLVDHGEMDLHFSPQAYPLFDRIIAEKSGNAALYDPDHPRYAEYEGLRTNIAVLRNFIFADTFRDGSFDPGDERHVPRIVGIAGVLGEGLRGDSWMGRVFLPAFNSHVAKVEGEGAAEMYEYLLKRQRQPGLFSQWRDLLLSLIGQPVREWGLPPLDETPFSEAGLNAPSAQHRPLAAAPETPTMTPPPAHEQANVHEQDARAAAAALAQVAQALETPTPRFKNVSEMDEPAREESVELAREILRKLKNMSFDDQELEVLLDQVAPKQQGNMALGFGENAAEGGSASQGIALHQKIENIRTQKIVKRAEKVAQIVEIYTNYLEQARETRPDIAESPRVQQANDAIGEYIHSVKLMAAKEIPNSIAAAQQIGADSTLDPADWDDLHRRATDRLMASLEGGMDELVSELDQQEMDADRANDELAQEAIDNSLRHGDQQRRRRRRRKQQSGYGGKAQLKKHLDLTADDFVLKQGRFRVAPAAPAQTAPPPAATAPLGLKSDDLNAIRALGNSLKAATDSGKELEDNMSKLAAEQRAQEIANPAAPLNAAQSVNADRDRTRRNPNTRRTT